MPSDNPYESTRLVDEYLLFHYGEDAVCLPWDFGPGNGLRFPVRTVEETVDWGAIHDSTSRALDVGCAVGRSAFELSRHCAEVIGIDFSQAFIDAAETLRTTGKLDYQCREEARLQSLRTAVVPESAHPERVRFLRGDAMDLDPALGAFDVVHAANLVCRLPDPVRFLSKLPAFVRPGGQLILTTPCTWLEEFTPPDRWPTHATLDFLRDQLEPAFVLRRTLDLPFLIREHRRKFQWSVAQGSVWIRTDGVE